MKAGLRGNGNGGGGRHPPKSLLTAMHKQGRFMHMRTTRNIDEHLLEKASHLTDIDEKTSLVRLGLEALIAQQAAVRLAHLGGSEKRLQLPPRRRSTAKR